MAIARPGPLVSALSGSIAGVTFKNTRIGCVITKRPAPQGGPSEKQLVNRANMSYLRKAWRELTDEKRNFWRLTAAQRLRPNALGTPRLLSPFQTYLELNLFLMAGGQSPVTLDPASGTAPQPVLFSINWSVPVTNPVLQFTPATMPTGTLIFVYGARTYRSTPPLSRIDLPLLTVDDGTAGVVSLRAGLEAGAGLPESDEYIAVAARLYTPSGWPSALSNQYADDRP